MKKSKFNGHELQKKLREDINVLMKSNNISQSEMARKMNVSRSFINLYLRHAIPMKLDTLYKFLKVFGLYPDIVYRRED